MARPTIPSSADEDLRQLLAGFDGLEHLQVKCRGKSLTLYSAGSEGTIDHARFTWLGGAMWGLSLPRHMGRWEKTPFMGSLEELMQILTQMLGFHLAARD